MFEEANSGVADLTDVLLSSADASSLEEGTVAGSAAAAASHREPPVHATQALRPPAHSCSRLNA